MTSPGAITGRAETPGDKQVVLEKIYDAWCKWPTMRLGQLIVAALRPKNAVPEIFYVEDDPLVAAIARSNQRYNPADCKHGFQAPCLDLATLRPNTNAWRPVGAGTLPEICGYCAAFEEPAEGLRRFRVWFRNNVEGKTRAVHGEGVAFADRSFAMRFPDSPTTLTGTMDDAHGWKRWWTGLYELEWLDP